MTNLAVILMPGRRALFRTDAVTPATARQQADEGIPPATTAVIFGRPPFRATGASSARIAYLPTRKACFVQALKGREITAGSRNMQCRRMASTPMRSHYDFDILVQCYQKAQQPLD